jgi:hypothetical protein
MPTIPKSTDRNPFASLDETTFRERYISTKRQQHLEHRAKMHRLAGIVTLVGAIAVAGVALALLAFFARGYLMVAGGALASGAKPFYDMYVQCHFSKEERKRFKIQEIETIRARSEKMFENCKNDKEKFQTILSKLQAMDAIPYDKLEEEDSESDSETADENADVESYLNLNLHPLIAGYEYWLEQHTNALVEMQNKFHECDNIRDILRGKQTEDGAGSSDQKVDTEKNKSPATSGSSPDTTAPASSQSSENTADENKNPTGVSASPDAAEPTSSQSAADSAASSESPQPTSPSANQAENPPSPPASAEPKQAEKESKEPEKNDPETLKAKLHQLRLEILTTHENALAYKVQAAFLHAVIQCPHFEGKFKHLASINLLDGNNIHAHLIAQQFGDPEADEFVTFKSFNDRSIRPITRKELMGENHLPMAKLAKRFKQAMMAFETSAKTA